MILIVSSRILSHSVSQMMCFHLSGEETSIQKTKERMCERGMLMKRLKEINVSLHEYNLFLSRVMFSILALFVCCVRCSSVCVCTMFECVCVYVCTNNKFVSHDYTAIIIIISFC